VKDPNCQTSRSVHTTEVEVELDLLNRDTNTESHRVVLPFSGRIEGDREVVTYDNTLDYPSILCSRVLPPMNKLMKDDTKEDRIGKEPIDEKCTSS
jgi:hypothetical protein